VRKIARPSALQNAGGLKFFHGEAFRKILNREKFVKKKGESGANDWIRTSDPRFTKALLYQLSYVGLQL
jgi:hypothetical protein